MVVFSQSIAGYFTEIATNPLLLLQDVLDIALIAVLVYAVLRFIRDTRASQLIKGLVLLLLLLVTTQIFNLAASYFLLSSILQYGVLALLIVFQPELRAALERMGRKTFNSLNFLTGDVSQKEGRAVSAIENICIAVANLSATKTGALIVMERDTKLGDIVKTGIHLDADLSAELIMNIFFPNASLHDGAMLVSDFRIHAAGCLLPLSTREIGSDLGTRHRAAIGISELSDAFVIVVSEETGIISIAEGGLLTRRISPETLKKHLSNHFVPKKATGKKDILAGLWRGKHHE